MNRFYFCIALLVAISLPSGCDGGTFLKGTIRDSGGKPVPNALIRLSVKDKHRDTISDDNGSFTISLLHAPLKVDLLLSVTKPGYLPYLKQFSSRDNLQTLTVQLVTERNTHTPIAQQGDEHSSTVALRPGCEIAGTNNPFLSADPIPEFSIASYHSSPLVSYQIEEDGSVSGVKLVRSSGVSKLDQVLIDSVKLWKYRPRPKCGVVDTQMSVTIDFQ